MKGAKLILPVITKKQCTEFGQAAALVLLFFAVKQKGTIYFTELAFIVMLITTIIPIVFFPFAVVWFSLSKVLSVIGPALMLGIVFLIFVTPVGLYRRLSGRDKLRLRQFKSGSASVFTNVNHTFIEKDLLHTF